jgi:hypothetical protein
VAGILLTIAILLTMEELFFPEGVAPSMIVGGAFAVFLWLNAYRISRKKAVNTST